MERLKNKFLKKYNDDKEIQKKKLNLTTSIFCNLDKELNRFFNKHLKIETEIKNSEKLLSIVKENKKLTFGNELCRRNHLIEEEEILNCFSILDKGDNINFMINYLKKNDQKKILILDLSINKNYGSKNLDDNILFISIFQENNIFNEKKENKNVLLYSLNKIENQFIGENDFIYLFERLIFPIIKNFDPNFIFFISDFYIDKNNKKILDLTQDTYMYYLYKLKNKISQKIHFILKIKNKENFFKEKTKEMFKNNFKKKDFLKKIKGIISILKGDFFPNKNSNIQMNFENLKISCLPISIFVKNLKETKKRWKKYFNFLETKSLLQYEKKIEKLLNCSLAGGHFHFFKIINKKIQKKLKKKELNFYLKTYPLMKKLKQLGPKIFEIKKKEKDYYLIMENLDANKNYSLLDFKIYGKINKSRLYLSGLFKKYHIGLAGYKILNKKKIVIEKRRSNFVRFSKKEALNTFSRFFLTENKQIFLKGILKIVSFLKKIEEIIYQFCYNISSGSIFVLFDPVDNDIRIKLIDFTYFGIEKNQNVRFSVKMAIEFFLEFYEFAENFNKESQFLNINN